MPQLPKSTSVNEPILLGNSRIIYLLLAVVLLFIIFFAYGIYKSKYFAVRNLTPKDFSSQAAKTNYAKFLTSGLRGNDWANLEKAFLVLVSDYNSSPSAAKRDSLIKLKDYLQKNYPNRFAVSGFDVPCREESCGFEVSYSDNLAKIKAEIESISTMSQDQKKSLLINLENAAAFIQKSDEANAFSSLSAVFSQLKSFYLERSDESVKVIVLQVSDELEKVDPELFKTGSERGYYKLEQ